MTEQELVAHTHQTGMLGYGGYAPELWTPYGISDGITNDRIQDQLGYRTSTPTGGGQPFNIVQPSKTKFIWTRIL